MDRTIGVLGGGQLGQMLCEAANSLSVKVVVLDAKNSPAKQVNARVTHVDGSYTDPEKIRELARLSDVLTVETEHVDTYVLEDIATRGVMINDENGSSKLKMVDIQPCWRTIRTIQDKYVQKEHLMKNGLQTVPHRSLNSNPEELIGFAQEFGFPFMLKTKKGAYDGKGNYVIKSSADINDALNALKGQELYAEKWANYRMEIAVMVAKTEDSVSMSGEATVAYPAVETVQEDNVCKLVYAPARNISDEILKNSQDIARKAVGSLWGKGVFGVELFLLDDDTLLVNEIAPRPHNSGHYTIEACPTFSQFKAHILSILDIMPKFTDSVIPCMAPASIMLNILGGALPSSHEEMVQCAVSIPSVGLHMYGKESKPGRKIGHATIVSKDMMEAEKSLAHLVHLADICRSARRNIPVPSIGLTTSTSKASSTVNPLIAITMGSDSDLPVMKPGLSLLETLGIPFFVTITSAHRTPERMLEFAASAASRGFKVIIAAAGGAAHLPGMLAASTPLPVIGVPVRGSTLDGMDSLLSIVQMPRGVPVATVAINNSINAALLACRILGASDLNIRKILVSYAEKMKDEATEKGKKLENVGASLYEM